MPSNASAGAAPDMDSWAGRGWQPERTYCTPRGGPQSTPRGSPLPAQQGSVSQSRAPNPGPDTLSGERAPRYEGSGGARWDWNGRVEWGHSGMGVHEAYTPRSRSTPPARAVAPHRRQARDVTGKGTGEPSGQENHRALDMDRTVAPYRRDPRIASKVSQAPHPAHRAGMREALYGVKAGLSSKDLAENEVQSLFMATALDVGKPVCKSVQKAQHAHAVKNEGLRMADDRHKDGWEAAVRSNRAFDGAFGASSMQTNQLQEKYDLDKQVHR